MNTPAHLIFGAAAFGKRGRPWMTTAAVAGSFLPDASLYFMVFWSRWVRRMSEQEIFGTAYFSEYWQNVFAIDNSIPLWFAALIASALFRNAIGVAFCGAGLMHLCLDFMLHHDDGRMHFWPFSKWVFDSPISYWDGSAYGHIVGPIEAVLCLILIVVLWSRHVRLWPRVLLVFAGLLELVPVLVFPFLFGLL